MPFIFKLSGGGAATTTYAGSYVQHLYIVSASLTGGIQLVAATGTMPQRLAAASEVFFTSSVAGQPLGSGIVNDEISDNNLWITLRNANQIVRLRKSDGTIITVITGSTTDPTRTVFAPEGINLGFNNRMWFASANNHLIGYVDQNTLACEMFTGSVSTPYQVVEYTPGKLLIRTGRTSSNVFREYTFDGSGSTNTITYTGRATGDSRYDVTQEIPSGTIYFVNSAGQMLAAPTTTLTGTNVGAATSTYPPFPGLSLVRYIQYVPQWQRFIAGNTDFFSFEATSSQMNSGTIYRVFDGHEWNNPYAISGATSYQRRMFCLDADKSRIWFFSLLSPTSVVSNLYNIRSLRLNVQKASWTFTPTASGTLQQIGFAGDLSNMHGQNPYTTNWPGQSNLGREFIEKTVRFYYSLDGGASRTEFTQGTYLNVPFSATASIVIDAEIQKSISKNGEGTGWISHGWILYG